jgi:hypothetical protein
MFVDMFSMICIFVLNEELKLTSDIQVRVPLNTACVYFLFSLVIVLTREIVLAVQNMSAYGAVAKSQEIEFNALQGSLNMMSKGNILCPFSCLHHSSHTSSERCPGFVSFFKMYAKFYFFNSLLVIAWTAGNLKA